LVATHKVGLLPVTIAWMLGGIVAASAATIQGQVEIGSGVVAGSAVTLWEASARAPRELGHAVTNADGHFAISGPISGIALYLLAKGGKPSTDGNKRDDSNLTLMALLGIKPPEKVVINELTTVASAYVAGRFITGDAISGNPLGLKIAVGNVANFVNLATGAWGDTLLDPLNSTQTTTLATFDTLGSLITAYATVADDRWRARFLADATASGLPAPVDTMQAMAGIDRESWVKANDLYALFDAAYPQPADGSRRGAPFVPYLAYAPSDFSLSLCFAGGGIYSAGRLMFDADGNLWSGQNWMAASQSGVVKSIGGGMVKMTPNGTPLSPPITGFTGMGIDGIGWGTAVTKHNVWATSFNGKILVMKLDGKPAYKESDVPFKQRLLGLMGVGVAADGDVWIADGSDDQLLYFPGGNLKAGQVVKVAGLKSPFDIVIDPQNRVWVSNSQSDTVLRFPANNPTKVDTFHVGLVVRALALDSKANVWVASNVSPNFPLPKVPEGASIMEQFEIMGDAAMNYPKPTGVISMIRPDGMQDTPSGYTGAGLVDIPWGLNIDGNDDVWIGNIGPVNNGVVFMAGHNTKGHGPGTKTGDVLHVFRGGSIQLLTDTSIDPAGDVWAANNWNDVAAATARAADPRKSTWGGGSGITVIYGVAAPVKPPRMGEVQGY
jgi:hypothetical protein